MAFFKYGDKAVYYEEIGTGLPVVFLHGDTASSKMFGYIIPFYTDSFRVILVDFLGNGQSDRIGEFPPDLWYSQAQQVIAFLEYLDCGKVSLIGTSGGAWVAVNAALERPDLVHRVVADSFDGRAFPDDFSETSEKRGQCQKITIFPGSSMNGAKEKIGKPLLTLIQGRWLKGGYLLGNRKNHGLGSGSNRHRIRLLGYPPVPFLIWEALQPYNPYV